MVEKLLRHKQTNGIDETNIAFYLSKLILKVVFVLVFFFH